MPTPPSMDAPVILAIGMVDAPASGAAAFSREHDHADEALAERMTQRAQEIGLPSSIVDYVG